MLQRPSPNRIHQRDMGAVITKAGNGCFGAVIGHLVLQPAGRRTPSGSLMLETWEGGLARSASHRPAARRRRWARWCAFAAKACNLAACGDGQIKLSFDQIFYAIIAEKLRAGPVDPKHGREIMRQHKLRIASGKAFADRIQRGNIDEGYDPDIRSLPIFSTARSALNVSLISFLQSRVHIALRYGLYFLH